jgi:tRNA(Met) cytidine acetyltransferase
LLREVFGLMVLAHYRTRPGDLQMLLEQEDISIALLRYQGRVIASAWLVDEPPLSDALAAAVFNGSRRLKGRLLPQSLLAHAGITDAGQYHYQRIIRIAVHPALQGRGFGRLLLAKVEQHSAQTQDLLGTSFAMETDLCRFWLQNGYHPVRLGQHQDEVTGSVAVMMLKAVSSQGQRLLKEAQQGLRQQWPFLLHTQLATLPPSLISVLLPALADSEKQLPAALMHTVVSFAHSQRSYESSLFALWQWLQTEQAITAFQQLDADQQTLLVELVMQQQALDRVVKQLELNGRAQLIKMLRQILASMLSSAQRQ